MNKTKRYIKKIKQKNKNIKKIIFWKNKKINQKHFYHFFERMEPRFALISSETDANAIYKKAKTFRNKLFFNKCNKIVILF